MKELFETEAKLIKDARFSPCGKYRFYLMRRWDDNLPTVAFIGLNPSTANATDDDPTIRSVRRICQNNGFGGFYMLNLYPFVSSDPSKIVKEYLVMNDEIINGISKGVTEIVFAWGNFPVAIERAKEVERMFSYPMCLGKNKNGSPKHPLYLKSTTKLVPYAIL